MQREFSLHPQKGGSKDRDGLQRGSQFLRTPETTTLFFLPATHTAGFHLPKDRPGCLSFQLHRFQGPGPRVLMRQSQKSAPYQAPVETTELLTHHLPITILQEDQGPGRDRPFKLTQHVGAKLSKAGSSTIYSLILKQGLDSIPGQELDHMLQLRVSATTEEIPCATTKT